MEAVIKVKASELTLSLLDRLKTLLSGDEDEIVTISFGRDAEYFSALMRSKYELENNKDLISFTMEELTAYTNEKK